MGLLDWPAAERPREKLKQRGAAALSDAELLAILLGASRLGVINLARQLLEIYGSLGRLFEAELGELVQIPGLGPAKSVQLKAVMALAERCAQANLHEGEAITDAMACARYLRYRLANREREVFAVLLLDAHHRLVHYEELFLGTVDGAHVHPREVVRVAIRHNACAVILAHNHPSGVAEASAADHRVTERLKSALSLIDVRVLDHLVVTAGSVTSFKQRGWL